MSYGSTIITVSQPYSDDSAHGFVELEQGPVVNPNTNFLTKAQAVGYISTWMFGTPPPPENCSNGIFERTIYAYPSRSGLAFRIGTSKGVLASAGMEPYEKVEIRQVEYETNIYSGGLPGEAVSAIWQGETYDYFGDSIVPPSLRPTGDTVDIGREAYGAVVITRRGTRYVYRLSISPPFEEDENSFQAVVYAVWDGGVRGLQVTAPDGVVEDECNNRFGRTPSDGDLTGVDEDDNEPEYVEGSDTTYYVDYCTNEITGG